MKKCGKIFLSLLLIALYSCNTASTQEAPETTNSTKEDLKEATAEQPKGQGVLFCDSIPLEPHSPDSPKMDLDIKLEPIRLSNDMATEKAVRSISYAITDKEYSTLQEACDSYVASHISNYENLRADYIDAKTNDGWTHWFNFYYMVNGICSKGYKGHMNYLLQFEEYTGGAHPYSYNVAFSFDPADGHEITLDEIMKENYEDTLLPLITQELMQHFKANTLEELGSYLFDPGNLFISKNIMMGADGLVIIYNKYEIAPYAMGDIILEIEYDKLKEIMK
jgi:hypothetical protein